MGLFCGARQGPERMERTIETHLFVVSPNNSGSTFLSLALAACRQAWSLPDESRLVHGFAGRLRSRVSRVPRPGSGGQGERP